jgi:hypothetical protein
LNRFNPAAGCDQKRHDQKAESYLFHQDVSIGSSSGGSHL